MKTEIHQLSSALINQIAAGEVIDRPASVLKELIENSLDAGASHIEIQIMQGGHGLIQVKDNGSGMNKKDLRLAFRRHATSKIKKLDDLNNINTLGFRGEALPSIASVSKVLTCSSQDGSSSYQIKIHGGEEKAFEPASGLKGSIITVKDLFFNTPARRKFLKKPQTEQAVINKVMRRFLYSRPDVSFKMISNDKMVYDVPAQELSQRITSLHGISYEKKLLPVIMEKSPYKISGYAGNLSMVKKRQGEQYLFLNGRYIQDRLLNSAVYSAYQSLVSRGEFPFFVLFLEMPLTAYDVNVHPGKLEVRFINEWQVYHVIKSSIANVLQDILNVIPGYNQYEKNRSYIENKTSELPFSGKAYSDMYASDKPPHQRLDQIRDVNLSIDDNDRLDRAHMRIRLKAEDIPAYSHELQSVTEHIWQIHNKYLITEIASGLIIIDQHVAHERILFEEAKNAMEGDGFASQIILFPQTVQLLEEEYTALIEITPYLEKIGFRFREFGKNIIIVEGVPPDINWGNEDRIIHEIIDQYLSIKKIDPSFIDQIAAVYACKSAIKAGDPLKYNERRNLIDRLFSTDHPYYCPHGRPIIVNLSIHELDERFERS